MGKENRSESVNISGKSFATLYKQPRSKSKQEKLARRIEAIEGSIKSLCAPQSFEMHSQYVERLSLFEQKYLKRKKAITETLPN